jgi:hypothetical protein
MIEIEEDAREGRTRETRARAHQLVGAREQFPISKTTKVYFALVLGYRYRKPFRFRVFSVA